VYLDLRMRCYFKDTLQNLHLLVIPMRERHTGKYQYGLYVAALDVLAPEWRHQLIGVASDGASTMIGCMQGTCTRLERKCHASIFRIWCTDQAVILLSLLMNKRVESLKCHECVLDSLIDRPVIPVNMLRNLSLQSPLNAFLTTRSS
jgi:hypothetical protein